MADMSNYLLWFINQQTFLGGTTLYRYVQYIVHDTNDIYAHIYTLHIISKKYKHIICCRVLKMKHIHIIHYTYIVKCVYVVYI